MNTFKRKDYGTWDVWHKSYTESELRARRAQLAKVVNARLLSLRRSKSSITGGRFIDAPQFDVILTALELSGKKTFQESKRAPGLSEHQIRTQISMFESFLEMKSSTVGGYREIERRRIHSFISKGIPEDVAKSKEFYDFLNSETFNDLERNYATSKKVIEMIDEYYDKGVSLQGILDGFNEFLKTKQKGEKALRDYMNSLM